MIKVNNLTKIYDINKPQETIALGGINFHIEKGEIVNIIGKSGSGKTTLGNILLGITKPTSGDFSISDIEFNKKSKKRKLRLITSKLLSSFQYPTHQLFTNSVKDELLFNNKSVTDEEIKIIMKLFSFDEKLLNSSPFKLSSGQKRKVILMALILSKPEVIVFDEPTSFLDAASRREFVEILHKINKEYNTTMLFISHNLNDAKLLSDRTIILDNGHLVKDGETNKVIDKYLNEVIGNGK